MKMLQPKPFTFQGDERGVLLLHGFTGHSADVRMLGRFLESQGFTCHAPIYRGHGLPPEELVKTNWQQWWEDVQAAYEHLIHNGCKKIAVVGLSLGGIFSLKLAMERPVEGIVTMCSPMYLKELEAMVEGVHTFAKEYKKREGKSDVQIEEEMNEFYNASVDTVRSVRLLIEKVRHQLDDIYAPLLVVQSRHDDVIAPQSATIIYNEVSSYKKELHWYEKSGHVITLDCEKDALHKDILSFLNGLNWE